MTGVQYDAFISYASPDVAFAEEVHRHLDEEGFCVWFDEARLNPGCDWHREIEAGCEASRVVIPLLTPRWKLSEWTKFETYGAEAVIPLIFEGEFADISTPPLTRFQGQALATGDDTSWQLLFAAMKSLLERPIPEKLSRLAHIRYRANPYFVGRERELNQIHESLHQNPTAVLTQGRVQAIAALGGVGKTTLARQYVERFWRCYPQIFWVDCRLGVENEFARLSDLLAPEQRESTNVVEKAHLALRSLESREDRLLVLDNAEDEATIQAWIPKTGNCRTLITSRFAAWSAAIKSIHLYVFEPGPANTLLATRAGRESFSALAIEDRSSCERLARELGYLPLALEQAAAYIEQQGPEFRFADYLRLYESATAKLLAAGVLGSTEYPDSVIATWKATTARLEPAARAILRLCAFLSPAPLPLSVLFEGAYIVREEAGDVAGSPTSTVSDDEVWIRQQVKQLRAYSMIEGDGQSVAIHPLVQAVERLQFGGPEARQATLRRSLHLIDAAFVGDPGDVRTWSKLHPLAPHARLVTEYADKEDISDSASRLMNQLGLLIYAKAQYSDAEPLIRRSLAIDEQSFGLHHLNVATGLNNLAQLLQDTNRLAEAEPLMRRVVAIFETRLGANDPNVASALNNLARLLQETNRLDEAEPLMRRSLEISEQSFGPGHPNVAIHLNNLANLLQDTNRLAEAEPLMQRVVKIFETSFGTNHPRVAVALNNLAQLLQETDRLAEAEPLMRRSLAIDEQSFGPDHPNVAIRLNNLAQLLQDTNRLAEAEPLMRRALAIDEQSFSPDHPKVAIRLNNLALLLQTTNRPAEAEPLMRRSLAIDEQSFGPNHPKVATDLNNLGLLLKATNRLAEAEPLVRRTLEVLLRFSVSTCHEHPNSRAAVWNYSALLEQMGYNADQVKDQLDNVCRPFGIQPGSGT